MKQDSKHKNPHSCFLILFLIQVIVFSDVSVQGSDGAISCLRVSCKMKRQVM